VVLPSVPKVVVVVLAYAQPLRANECFMLVVAALEVLRQVHFPAWALLAAVMVL
jgi:hypothetical protein